MTGTETLTHEALLERLQGLAEKALHRYDLPGGVTARLINVSENATYRLDDAKSGTRWALRIHREGYHSRTAIASELAWQNALRADGAANTPVPVRGRDGDLIQTVSIDGLPAPRNVVLFNWEEGREPDPADPSGYELLGETAARMHAQVKAWNRPPWFERHTWDFETSLGDKPHWGRWRQGMGLTPEIEKVFERTVDLIRRRLERYGKAPDRFNLVHGDMRLANLLLDGKTVKVIDFDDCGFSWLMYDCATTVSFFEEKPEVPDLVKAWVRGYRRVAPLSAEDEHEIETFVMLRRILLIAWIGSHSETELAQSMGVTYTQSAVPLCESYLAKFGEGGAAAQPSAAAVERRSVWQRLFG